MKTLYLKELGLFVIDPGYQTVDATCKEIPPSHLYFYSKVLKFFNAMTETKSVNKAKQILLSLMDESGEYSPHLGKFANNPYSFYTPSHPTYLMTIKHRIEVYLPIAILKHGRVCGGGYFFPMFCGKEPNDIKSVHKNHYF